MLWAPGAIRQPGGERGRRSTPRLPSRQSPELPQHSLRAFADSGERVLRRSALVLDLRAFELIRDDPIELSLSAATTTPASRALYRAADRARPLCSRPRTLARVSPSAGRASTCRAPHPSATMGPAYGPRVSSSSWRFGSQSNGATELFSKTIPGFPYLVTRWHPHIQATNAPLRLGRRDQRALPRTWFTVLPTLELPIERSATSRSSGVHDSGVMRFGYLAAGRKMRTVKVTRPGWPRNVLTAVLQRLRST